MNFQVLVVLLNFSNNSQTVTITFTRKNNVFLRQQQQHQYSNNEKQQCKQAVFEQQHKA